MPVIDRKRSRVISRARSPPPPDPASARSTCHANDVRQRIAEIRNSLRWACVLVGLVGINVYIFFFNRGTAPREVLNLQSTVEDDRGEAQETLQRSTPTRSGSAGAQDAGEAPPPPRRVAAGRTVPTPAPRRRLPANAGERRPRRGARASRSDPVRTAARPVRGGPARRWFRFRSPPPEDDTADEKRVEKKFAATRWGRCWRAKGSAPPARNVIAALAKLLDPEAIRGGQKYVVRPGDDGTPDVVRVPADAGPALPRRARTTESGALDRRASSSRPSRSRPPRRAASSSRRSTSRCRRRASRRALVSLLVELFAWDVNFYIDTHPGDHWKVVVEKQYLGGQFYKYGRMLAAEYGGKVGTFRAFYCRQGRAARARRASTTTSRGRRSPKTHAEDAAALRAHQLEVRSQALPPDPARREGAPGHRLRRAGRARRSGRRPAGASSRCGMKRGSGNTIVIAHANGLSTALLPPVAVRARACTSASR